MIDAALLPIVNKLLRPLASQLAERDISADRLTIGGFVIGAAAMPALAFGFWWLALTMILVNRLSDGLDGAVARLSQPTRRGAFLDIALDFAFYALVPLGFALNDPAANSIPAAVLIAAFAATGSAFLAFAAVAAKTGATTPMYPTKGIYYLGGLTEGFETIVVFVLMCLFPAQFPLLAYVFAAACWVTTVLRWRQGWIAFGG